MPAMPEIRPSITTVAFLSIVVLIISILCPTPSQSRSYKHYDQPKQWKFLEFARIWPSGSCHSPEKQKCFIPQNMTSWTIHGLWPSFTPGEGPAFCNSSWHFKPELLSNITGELEARWGNMLINKSVHSLWKHEWEKHGTCAATDQRLGSEYLYFRQGLDFYYRFNLEKILNQFGIFPQASKTYPKTQIRDAIIKGIGKNVTLECEHKKNVTPALVSGITMCIDLNFMAMHCADDFSNCSDDVLLLPIVH